ncbi:MAG: hypothetical protein WAU65_01510 [Candidatus Nanoarchaeia archaeon]
MDNITASEIRKYSKIFEPITFIENEGSPFDENSFSPGLISDKDYYSARSYLVRGSVDGLIACLNEKNERGILLITRKGHPAKDLLWPIGGGIPRGTIGLRNALSANAKREANLNLSDFVYFGGADCGWTTISKNINKGGKGVRDYMGIYYAQGEGELKF